MIFAMHDPLADLLGEWSRGLNTGSVLLRIALAVLLASVIGCERSSKRHSAGLRTFVLVSFASTVFPLSHKSSVTSPPSLNTGKFRPIRFSGYSDSSFL